MIYTPTGVHTNMNGHDDPHEWGIDPMDKTFWMPQIPQNNLNISINILSSIN